MILNLGTASYVCHDTAIVSGGVFANTPASITTTAGQVFSGQVGSFTYWNDNDPSYTNLQADIDWGDGQTSEGTVYGGSEYGGTGSFTVNGSNIYAEGGTYNITITFFEGTTELEVVNGDANGFQIDATATVADAGRLSSTPSGGDSFPIEIPLQIDDSLPFDGKVGTFYDSDLNATADKYTIAIDFGDGEGASVGYVQPDGYGDGGWDLFGDHDYISAGFYDGNYTISEPGGTTFQAGFYANVVDNPVIAVGALPTIRITSRGSDPGDAVPGPIPTDVEGMKYTVGQKLNSPAPYKDPTSGKAISYGFSGKFVYNYPASAVKGYGVFDNNNASGSTNLFTGDPTSAFNTKVQVGLFTPNDQMIDQANGDFAFVDSFYWGPSAQGIQTIGVTAYFNKYINGVLQPGQVTASDTVQVNVLKPTGIIDPTLGQPGMEVQIMEDPRLELTKIPFRKTELSLMAKSGSTCLRPSSRPTQRLKAEWLLPRSILLTQFFTMLRVIKDLG